MINRLFSKNNTQWLDKAIELKAALISGQAEQAEAILNQMLLSFVSVRDTAKREEFYHGFMLGVLSTSAVTTQQLSSEQESGPGILRSGSD